MYATQKYGQLVQELSRLFTTYAREKCRKIKQIKLGKRTRHTEKTSFASTGSLSRTDPIPIIDDGTPMSTAEQYKLQFSAILSEDPSNYWKQIK